MLGAIIVAGIFVVIQRRDARVLAGNIGITAYPNGMVMVQVPYRHDGERGTLTVSLDLNADGAFSESEIVVRGFPGLPRKYGNSNYFFRPASAIPDDVQIRVSFDGVYPQTIEKTVSVARSSDTGIKSELAGVTKPDLSMKEGEAPHGLQSVQRDGDVPDLTQRKAECAPTAAANSLISLAKEHGADGKLPADPLTIIDELKGDMRWTPADGVLPDDFVRGKNEWAAKKGLPIRTEMIGDAQGTKTVDALFDALKNGKAAELRLRFAEPNGRGGYKVTGGHLVTVVSVTKTDNGTFIDVNDPRTPNGTETYHIEGNQIEGYGLWTDGPTILGIAFSQTWTGQNLEPMTDAELQGIREFAGEKRKIKALHIGDRYIPLEQVHVSGADLCDGNHWHANIGGSAHDTAGKVFSEIFEHCGYGKVTDVPVVDVDVP